MTRKLFILSSLIIAAQLVGCSSLASKAMMASVDPYKEVTQGPDFERYQTPFKENPSLNGFNNYFLLFDSHPVPIPVPKAPAPAVATTAPSTQSDSGILQRGTATDITTASQFLSAPTGFTPASSLVMNSLNYLFAPSTKSTARKTQNYLLAFVPKSEAATPGAAMDYVRQGLNKYFEDLAAQGVSYPVASVKDPVGKGGVFFTTADPVAMQGTPKFSDLPIYVQFTEFSTTVVSGYAPVALGSYPCYVVRVENIWTGLHTFQGDLVQSDKTDISVMRERARLTPKWMSFILEANNLSAVKDGKRTKLLSPGVIYNSTLYVNE